MKISFSQRLLLKLPLVAVVVCALVSPAWGQQQSIAGEAGEVATGIFSKVGEAVGGTVKGIGESVSDTSNTLFGSKDVSVARAEIDAKADKALQHLLARSRSARTLFEASYGYAAFDSRKISLMLTTGTGSGVVVEKGPRKRTYMHMATAGAGLGMGAQFFSVVFLFQNKESLNTFIRNGWEANAAASAVFGKDSLEGNVRFVEGMAVYQLNEAGVMADLNLTGTRYWTSGELNAAG